MELSDYYLGMIGLSVRLSYCINDPARMRFEERRGR